MIRVFASVYGSLRNLFTDLDGDKALNINGCSDVKNYESTDLPSAVAHFQDSEEFYSFCERFIDKTVYTYNMNDDGTVCRIDGIVLPTSK